MDKEKAGNENEEDHGDQGQGLADERPFLPQDNPLLIKVISQRVFSVMASRDLLSARLVCRAWKDLATKEYRGRTMSVGRVANKRGVDQNIYSQHDENIKSDHVLEFIKVMTPSTLLPVARLWFSVDPLKLGNDPSAFLKLLTFAAPWLKSLRIQFSLFHSTEATLDERDTGKAVQLFSTLGELGGLQFHALEKLVVEDQRFDEETSVNQAVVMSMLIIVKGILKGAVNLKSFTYARFDERQEAELEFSKIIIDSLPSSLKHLSFPMHYDENSPADYEALNNLKFELEKFEEHDEPCDILEFVKFLHRQQPYLRSLTLMGLENYYQDILLEDLDLPQFQHITSLSMSLGRDCTLKLLIKHFPSLRELELSLVNPKVGHEIENNHSHFPQHRRLRKLTIEPLCGTTSQMASFLHLISHAFPNLTHLNFECRHYPGAIPQVFTHLTGLERLKLNWPRFAEVEPTLESILSGIPHPICEELRGMDVSDRNGFKVVTDRARNLEPFAVGLANLKKLKLLELGGSSAHHQLILTSTFFHECFMKMVALKELWLHQQLPQASEVGRPVIEALKGHGIDVYRIKLPFAFIQ